MDKSARQPVNDPQFLEISLELTRIKLAREASSERDNTKNLQRLKKLDPIADEIVRQLAGVYYFRHENMKQKEEAVHVLVTAFLLYLDVYQSLSRFDGKSYRAALDKLADENGTT